VVQVYGPKKKQPLFKPNTLVHVHHYSFSWSTNLYEKGITANPITRNPHSPKPR